MNKMQRSALRRFRRVRDFLASDPQVGDDRRAGQTVAGAGQVLEKLSQNGEEQDASLRFTRRPGGSVRRGEVAVQLLHTIVKVA